MIFKHHIGGGPKPISNLFQTSYNYHSYGTHIAHNIYELLLLDAKQFIKHSPTLIIGLDSGKISADVSYLL